VEKKRSKWNLNVSRLYKEDLEKEEDLGELGYSEFVKIVEGKHHPILEAEEDEKVPELYNREQIFHRF